MHIDQCHPILVLFILTLNKVLSIPITEIESTSGVLVRTVPGGTTVILKCLSNDEGHNFQYWHLLNRGIIIGPANPYDLAKFRFEILSGNLTIKAVSKQEEGFYECVSRAVHGEDLNIRVVRMVVQSDDWDVVYDHDYHINVIRILIALITLVLISMGAWFAYRIWKDRYRYPSYLQNEEDDDDSTEEIFSQPSTSKSTVNNIIPAKTKPIVKESAFDDIDISTDFKSILDTANEK